jgi:hypothetical protein
MVDMFLGVGFGAHFIDVTAGASSQSDTRLGGNLQFGVEVHPWERAGFFGVGRVDQLQGDRNRQQSKIWGGVRLRF